MILKLTQENLRFQYGEEKQQKRYLELIRKFSEMNEEFVNQKLKSEYQLKTELETCKLRIEELESMLAYVKDMSQREINRL